MTIKQLHAMTPETQGIYIADANGCIFGLNRKDIIQLAAYGDFIIASVEAREENKIEVTVLMQPVKEGNQ